VESLPFQPSPKPPLEFLPTSEHEETPLCPRLCFRCDFFSPLVYESQKRPYAMLRVLSLSSCFPPRQGGSFKVGPRLKLHSRPFCWAPVGGILPLTLFGSQSRGPKARPPYQPLFSLPSASNLKLVPLREAAPRLPCTGSSFLRGGFCGNPLCIGPVLLVRCLARRVLWMISAEGLLFSKESFFVRVVL